MSEQTVRLILTHVTVAIWGLMAGWILYSYLPARTVGACIPAPIMPVCAYKKLSGHAAHCGSV